MLIDYVFLRYTMCFLDWFFHFYFPLIVIRRLAVLIPCVGVSMSKIRLFVRVRKQGSRIESVPLKKLIKLSGFHQKRWEFKDGWLILEAM